MLVTINNYFPSEEIYYISYGLVIQLESDSVPGFRNRIGVDIEVNGYYIGSAEIDIAASNINYDLNVGQVIKDYVNAPTMPSAPFNAWVDGKVSDIKLTPYGTYRQSDSAWTGHDVGTPVSFGASRGIHKSYYVDGSTVNSTPSGSPVFDSEGTITIDRLKGNENEFLYYALDVYSMAQVYMLSGTMKWYSSSGVLLDSQAYVYTTSSDLNERTVAFNIKARNIIAEEATKLVLTADLYLRDGGGTFNVIKTSDVIVNYKCKDDYDHKLSVVFLDNNYNWVSIPFFKKNTATYKRDAVNTIGYDFSKQERALQVRKSYKLKSDYLDRYNADAAMLFGLVTSLKVSFPGSDEIHDAVLIDKSLELISRKNEGMAQLEIEVELSDIIKLP